jgi:hypothetical protein
LIDKVDMKSVELENITQLECQNEDEKWLVNVFIKNYVLIVSLRKIIEDLNNTIINYENLFKNYMNLNIKRYYLIYTNKNYIEKKMLRTSLIKKEMN